MSCLMQLLAQHCSNGSVYTHATCNTIAVQRLYMLVLCTHVQYNCYSLHFNVIVHNAVKHEKSNILQMCSDNRILCNYNYPMHYFQFQCRWSLHTITMIGRDLQEYRRPQESMLIPTVNHLRVVGCENVSARRDERKKFNKQDYRSSKKSMKAYYITINYKLTSKDDKQDQKTDAPRPDISQHSLQYDCLY